MHLRAHGQPHYEHTPRTRFALDPCWKLHLNTLHLNRARISTTSGQYLHSIGSTDVHLKMKAAPLLISWHNESQPIYSVHFDPHGQGRLATAGGDNNVRIWQLEKEGDEVRVEYRATLLRHTQTVNVVRFCPKGETLASAGDDGNVLLWIPSDLPTTTMGEDHTDDKESWRIKHMCRTSTGAEIYDLAWSPDGRYFIIGAMDNTARIFDAQSGEPTSVFTALTN